MSQEDTLIVALTSMMDTTQQKVKSIKKKSKLNDNSVDTTDSKDSNKAKYQESRNSEWKKTPTVEGEVSTEFVNNYTYYWYKTCGNGQGMWTIH